MLVSHRHRFVFLKTTKTAGTSTELYFQPACMPPSTERLDWAQSHSQPEELVSDHGIVGVRAKRVGSETFYNHMPAREVIAAIGQDVWDDYFRFANVRNPWDKVVSHYFFKADWRGADGSVPQLSVLTEGIEAFVAGYRRPAVEAFLAPEGPRVTDVIRYERLADDVQRVAAAVGYDGGPELPRLKVDTRPDGFRDYRALYSDTARSRVADVFADWIDAYGYRF